MMYNPSITALGLAAALSAPAAAFFRIPCPGRIVTERADPIVAPGAVADHVHSIAGGNGFGFNMTYEQARTSTCSSCPIQQDLSNYWTPSLYYQFENGSFESVAQVGDGVGVFGGQNVYYLQRPGPDNDTLYAFPEGFRMLAGDPMKRNSTDDFASQAVSFVCLDYSGTSSQSTGFPTINCPDGLRAQIFFPSCWNGVDLDSPDHKSHMAYPANGSYDNGPCPASHPVHMISIFYEVLWNTGVYSDMWYGSGQPFVFSMGDPTGYGMHGDFVNGWDVSVLQEAVDTCNDDSGLITDCAVFEFFTDEQSQACIVPTQVDEQVYGYLDALPGCNPVQAGPEEATAEACAAGVIGPFKQYFTDVTATLGWEYIGCGSDSTSGRTLTGSDEFTNSVDVETCIDYCEGLGYTIAGMEYSSQCYCGDSVAADRAPVDHVLGNCFSPCAGNSSEYCGGSNALSLYQKCESGGNCTNIPYTPPYADGDVASNLTSTTSSNATFATSSVAAGATSGSSSSSSAASTSSGTGSGSSSGSSAAASSPAAPYSSPSSSASSASSTSSATGSSNSSALDLLASPTSTTKSSSGWTAAQRAVMVAAWKEHRIAEQQAAAVNATLAEYEKE